MEKLFKAIICFVILFFHFQGTLFAETGKDWVCTTSAAGWSGRWLFASAVFKSKMWIMGGMTGAPGAVYYARDVWYSSDGISWTCATASAPWGRRNEFRAIVFDNKLWIMGGTYLYEGASDAYYVYYKDIWNTSDGVNWTRVTASAPWNHRVSFGLAVFRNKLWVMGGGYAGLGAIYGDVWCSDDGINWTCVNSSAPWGPATIENVIVYDNKMWIKVGGDIWRSSNGTNWTRVRNLLDPYGDLQGVVFDNKMWLIGSSNPKYSTNGAIWTTVNAEDMPLKYRGAVLVFDSRLWNIGGYYWGFRNDVWYTTSDIEDPS